MNHPRQWPRGPVTELHKAAGVGSAEGVEALLLRGFNIDQGDPEGASPLLYAALKGSLSVAVMLLSNGASVSVVADGGFSALHYSAQNGHIGMTTLLRNAGSDLEAKSLQGSTPLHMAARHGQWRVVQFLIKEGANVDSRRVDGGTPLYLAAQEGHVDAIKQLLLNEANPSLPMSRAGHDFVPLDIAAEHGHLEAAQELIQKVAIEGCGGVSGGVFALRLAAQEQRIDIMALLTDAGVVDTSEALCAAIRCGHETCTRFLLQQQDDRAYVNAGSSSGVTPLLCALGFNGVCSPRIMRLLVDAGAETTSAFRLTDTTGRVLLNDTPLAFATRCLNDRSFVRKCPIGEKLCRLEAIRRLLLRVEAIHAVSWLWSSNSLSTPHVERSAGRANTTLTAGTALKKVISILRRRSRRRGVLFATLYRCSSKP